VNELKKARKLLKEQRTQQLTQNLSGRFRTDNHNYDLSSARKFSRKKEEPSSDIVEFKVNHIFKPRKNKNWYFIKLFKKEMELQKQQNDQ